MSMQTIRDKLAGNSQQQPAQQKMPTPPPNPAPKAGPLTIPAAADPRALHPAVQAHAMAWSEMLQEADQLRETVRKLTNDLQVQREINQRLEFMLQDERQRLSEFDRLKDKYLRFAQEILTHTEGAVDMLQKARLRAMEAAQTHEPNRVQVEQQFEKAVAEAVSPRDEPMPTDTADVRAD